ncbi:replication-relaxation family protein (plasmid) [Kitasatospora griseola]|uniref:replication-relaxation family protein n=1 Tax=Kitasatospora griseola TaxID=2064 RepID=UPI0038559BC4
MRVEILTVLACVRVATAAQLHQVVTSPRKTARTAYVRRGLNDLLEMGLVGQVRIGRGFAWFLTERGRKTVEAGGEYEVRPGAGTGQAAAEGQLLDHALAVTDTVLSFARHGAAALVDCQLEVAHTWGKTAGQRLNADVVVTGPVAGHAALLVEVDRSTMRQAAMARKFTRYAAYATVKVWQGQRGTIGEHVPFWRRAYPGRRFPPLLLVLAEEPGPAFEHRMGVIRQALARTEHAQALRVWAAPLDWLQQHGPASRIWQSPHERGRRTLAEI